MLAPRNQVLKPGEEIVVDHGAHQPGSPPVTLRRGGILHILRILGPGLITGASDDDPSGIGTYSQVGSQFGYGLLWTALFTLPLLTAVQELCGRIALQSGVGLGVLLKRKFPVPLVALCVSALFIANTINVGADLGAIAAGGQLLSRGLIPAVWLVVPAALLIGGLQLFTSYRVILRIFKYLTLALFAYVIAAVIAHPQGLAVVSSTFVPHIQISASFIAALVAVLGTTISPYLFFWQASSEVDEMKTAGLLTRRQRHGTTVAELGTARLDIGIGMVLSQVVMYCILLTCGTVLHGHGIDDIATPDQAAAALAPVAGQFAFIVFAVGMIGAGLLAIPVLAASAAYAVKEAVGIRGALAMRLRHAPTFYGLMLVAICTGVVINFSHVNPVRALFITAVINGIVAPPLLLLITLVGSDARIMGTRVSGRLSRGLTWLAFVVTSAAVAGLILTTWGPWAPGG